MFSKNKVLKSFIVLEGLDGNGSTTQQRLLIDALQREEIPCNSTSEPTNSSIGKLIRKILSSKEKIECSTLAHLFAADRNEHLHGQDGIVDCCSRNSLVICDRYFFSSLAYQGLNIGMDTVWDLNKHFPLPEITFFMDIDPQRAEQRYNSRQNQEVYEKRKLQEQIQKNFHYLFSNLDRYPAKFYYIDANRGTEDIFSDIWRVISSLPIVKE